MLQFVHGLRLRDGIPDRPFEQLRSNFVFSKKIRCAERHRFNVELMIANPGQKDYRSDAADIARFFEDFKAVSAVNSEIEQTYVVRTPPY
jgi:hypothetical protein